MATAGVKRNYSDSEAATEPENTRGMRAKKKRRICELVGCLERYRKAEKRAFGKLMRRAESLYRDISQFTAKYLANPSAVGAKEQWQPLGATLAELVDHVRWREQARGPTSMRSAKVKGLDDVKFWEHHPIWVVCTPRTERTVVTHGRTLNYAEGEFMTWGLPEEHAFDRKVFKQCRLVWVIEKLKGGSQVEHRIKNLYLCLTRAKSSDDKIYLVTWTYFMECVTSGRKVCPPEWCRRVKSA